MTKGLAISNDPMYQLIREGKIEEFNAKKQSGEYCNLKGCDFRSLDLRGIDLRGSLLDGCSIDAAKIFGTYFPLNILAQEILLSLEHGTRLRVIHEKKQPE